MYFWLAVARQALSSLRAALRVEWLKARARAKRFQEEVQLLEEEKRRVLVSLEQNAHVWDQREGYVLSNLEASAVTQGAAAYAAEQAALQRALKAKFQNMWLSPAVDPVSATNNTDDGEAEDEVDGDLEYIYSDVESDENNGDCDGEVSDIED